MPIKQDNRLVAIKTALGPDVLAVRSIAVQEQLSRLFQIDAELSSEDGEIDLDKVVGHDVTLRLFVAQKEKRYFHGFVSRLVQVGNVGKHAHYRATIVPWFWFLTRTSDCCIFQDMSVPDIIEDIFKFYGFNDYQLKLSGNYEKKEYCVQYRETDFNFVSRLMEQEGIYYFFQHEDGKHTLVLADSISAHKAYPGYSDLTFHELETGGMDREVVTDWTVEKEVQPVAFALNDFDFKKPKTSLRVSSNVSRKYGKAEYEIYDAPGEYVENNDGERLADVRLNELQSQYEVLRAEASARGVAAGSTFKLKNHPRADQNREYLITGVSMNVDAGEFAAEGAGSEGESVSCNFTAIDKQQQFRPTRLTPKPIVQGPQTAIVVGPSGEEIYTDEHGRVKVHFHWDRHDKSDENSSCWIRVSQFWAGKEWGSIHIPRIKQEVIVEFLEGDPDRPIITGRVYNADQVPPYGLPDNKTQSGWKSRSSKGGSTANFNEIRFEDKKGDELMVLHAEKDQKMIIENDRGVDVGRDKSEAVHRHKAIQVDGNHSETINGNKTLGVGGSHSEQIGGNMSLTVSEAKAETVALASALTIGAAYQISVGAVMNTTVGASKSEEVGAFRTAAVGGNDTERIGGKQDVSVSHDYALAVGKNLGIVVKEKGTVQTTKDLDVGTEKNLNIKAKESILIQSDKDITVKAGDAQVTLKKDGTIEIKGAKINIKGSGDVKIKGSSVAIN